MEEELEFLSENATEVLNWNRPAFLIVYDVLLPAFCIVGILGEIAIIFLVTRWHHLRSVTNIILAHWSLLDLLFTFFSCVLYHLTLYYRQLGIYDISVIVGLEQLLLTTLNFGQIICIYLLLTNFLLNSEKFKMKLIVLGLYVLIALFFFTVLMVHLQKMHMIIIQAVNTGLYVLVILTVIIKLIKDKIKKNDTPVNKNNEMRFRIVCIYISLWLVSLGSVILGLYVRALSYLFVFGHVQNLTPLCIILYLRTVDPNFRLCLIKMLRNSSEQDERVIFQVNQLVEDRV